MNEGKVVGIFPEGGSHDRPDLLPIKAGISIMALGIKSMNYRRNDINIKKYINFSMWSKLL